eukprot:TRINITY_DN10099_c0_g2_i3.p1 TRINITY_DN10099_c0_g2~~TRINITY_DN10099_c0_g2_i3.p1  ORF type:complete len:1726 (+),score=460.60 TRINITY_DN10099_c0_g2_i3:168-5345(+)
MWGFIHPNSPVNRDIECNHLGLHSESHVLTLPFKPGTSALSRRPKPVFDPASPAGLSAISAMALDNEMSPSASSRADPFGLESRPLTPASVRRGDAAGRLQALVERAAAEPATPLQGGRPCFGVASAPNLLTGNANVTCLARGRHMRRAGAAGGCKGGGAALRGSSSAGQLPGGVREDAAWSGKEIAKSRVEQSSGYWTGDATRMNHEAAAALNPDSPGNKRLELQRKKAQQQRAAEKAQEKRGHATSAIAALDRDKKYQEELLQRWHAEKIAAGAILDDTSVYMSQAKLLFDFLKSPTGEGLIPGAEKYVLDAIPILKRLQEYDVARIRQEIHANMPTFDIRAVVPLSGQQDGELRHVLSLYAQVSRPPSMGQSSAKSPTDHSASKKDNGLVGGHADSIPSRIDRFTFCRFLLDCNVCEMDPDDKYKRPSFHRAVRYFDFVVQNDHPKGEKTDGSVGERGATMDACITVVAQLVHETTGGEEQEVMADFSKGLQRAEGIVMKVQEELRRKTTQQLKAVEYMSSDEACQQRLLDAVQKHGTPPTSFQGSLWEWTRGIKLWAVEANNNVMPHNLQERLERQLAVENYLRDALTDPSCIHVCIKYAGLFRVLFEAYCDEERLKCFKVGNRGGMEWVPHMSYAAFFRFCLDFSIFPTLCSFDHLYEAYRSADGATDLKAEDELPDLPRKGSQLGSSSAEQKVVSVASWLRGGSHGSNDADGYNDDDLLALPPSEKDSDEEEGGAAPMERKTTPSPPPKAFLIRPGQAAKELSRSPRPTALAAGTLSPPRHPSPRPPQAEGSSMAPSRRRLSIGQESPPLGVPGARRGTSAAEAAKQAVAAATKHAKAEAQKQEVDEKKEAIEEAARVSTVAPRRCSKVFILAEDLPPAEPDKPWLLRLKGVQTPLEQKPATKKAQVQIDPAEGGCSDGESATPRSTSSSSSSESVDSSMSDDSSVPVIIVKVSNDFSWLSRRFSEMMEHEKDTYALLSALGDCQSGRFLPVRDLIMLTGQVQNRKGYISASGAIKAFKSLRVTHKFKDTADMERFIALVDPKNPDGRLDVAELEKAVEYVKEDRKARGSLDESCMMFPLGDKARILSSGGSKNLVSKGGREPQPQPPQQQQPPASRQTSKLPGATMDGAKAQGNGKAQTDNDRKKSTFGSPTKERKSVLGMDKNSPEPKGGLASRRRSMANGTKTTPEEEAVAEFENERRRLEEKKEQAAKNLEEAFQSLLQLEEQTAFGLDAFTECLLLLGVTHMAGSGSTFKATAPLGVVLPWLIAFLRYRFHKLKEENDSIKKQAKRSGKRRPSLAVNPPIDHDSVGVHCSCGILFDEGVNFCRKCGAARPSKEELVNKRLGLPAPPTPKSPMPSLSPIAKDMTSLQVPQRSRSRLAVSPRGTGMTAQNSQPKLGRESTIPREAITRRSQAAPLSPGPGSRSPISASPSPSSASPMLSPPNEEVGANPRKSSTSRDFMCVAEAVVASIKMRNSISRSPDALRKGHHREPSPPGARYHSPLIRLLEQCGDIFEQCLHHGLERGKRGECIKIGAKEPCKQCGQLRGSSRVGNIFCHRCSGVDEWNLGSCLLRSVLQRKRVNLLAHRRKLLEQAHDSSISLLQMGGSPAHMVDLAEQIKQKQAREMRLGGSKDMGGKKKKKKDGKQESILQQRRGGISNTAGGGFERKETPGKDAPRSESKGKFQKVLNAVRLSQKGLKGAVGAVQRGSALATNPPKK